MLYGRGEYKSFTLQNCCSITCLRIVLQMILHVVSPQERKLENTTMILHKILQFHLNTLYIKTIFCSISSIINQWCCKNSLFLMINIKKEPIWQYKENLVIQVLQNLILNFKINIYLDTHLTIAGAGDTSDCHLIQPVPDPFHHLHISKLPCSIRRLEI